MVLSHAMVLLVLALILILQGVRPRSDSAVIQYTVKIILTTKGYTTQESQRKNFYHWVLALKIWLLGWVSIESNFCWHVWWRCSWRTLGMKKYKSFDESKGKASKAIKWVFRYALYFTDNKSQGMWIPSQEMDEPQKKSMRGIILTFLQHNFTAGATQFS